MHIILLIERPDRLPDEEAGEIPAACVVMNESAKESEEEIMSFVASNVASYKRVRLVQFVDSIPKSASGKIMRRFLKEKAAKKRLLQAIN